MAPPVIAVAQDRPGELFELLERRFGREYAVEAHTSLAALADASQRWAAAGWTAALVLADRHVGGEPSTPLLARLRDAHPDVVRCVLLPYFDPEASRAVANAVAVGDVDRYISVPWGSPDVGLYPAVTELLSGWWRATSPATAAPVLLHVVAPAHSRRAHEMRDLLDRNVVPSRFLDPEGDAAAALRAAAGAAPDDVLVQLPDGRVLVNADNRTIAAQLGAPTAPSADAVDVVVVGGGPSGLAATVYAASEGLRTLVVERAALGGQAGTSSHIRNYPGFPHGVSGTDLATRAAEQGWLFGAEFVNTNPVEQIAPGGDGRHRVRLADGTEVTTRAVVLAIGVDYRRLQAPGVERLTGAGIFYGAARAEAPGFVDRRVFIVGAGNSAGQAAAHLARFAEQVTLLVRGASLETSMSDYLVQQLARTPNVAVNLRSEIAEARGQHHLESLVVRSAGELTAVPADGLFILIGAQPQTRWLPGAILRDDHGFVLTDADLPAGHAALPYETSLQGVFAVGDVRHGSVKRVASAVGEGAVCISSVHRRLDATAARR